jgi:ribosomal protein S18 acetylase RimI-like enzyme
MPQFRAAQPEDREAVNKLWQDGDIAKASDQQWHAITSNDCARLLVAEEVGVIVGAAIAAYDGWRAYVYHVAVAPQARRHGVATALLSKAEDDVRQRGAERIFALVHESRTEGLALSAACGYEMEGDRAFVKTCD